MLVYQSHRHVVLAAVPLPPEPAQIKVNQLQLDQTIRSKTAYLFHDLQYVFRRCLSSWFMTDASSMRTRHAAHR